MKNFYLIFTIILVSGFITISSAQNIEDVSNGSRDWSIVASYPIPEGASGLAWDGTYLYCGIYGADGDEVYKIDPTNGSYSLQCIGPQDDAFGLTWDGTNLWTIIQPSGSQNPALATEFTLSGSQVSQITLADHYMSGIAYDGGDFWVSTYYDPDGWIYKINDQGTILQDFVAPDNQPWDLCIDGDYLWMADYWGDALYKIEKATGTTIETHPSEGVDPAGIVFDGEFLWYCDNGSNYDNDILYKVDLYGAGTPAINVPVTLHNYGTVTIGDYEIWQCEVENIGTANLTITDIIIPAGEPISTTFSTPQTLEPGDAVYVPLRYQPTEVGELNTNITIVSNDPINPEVEVFLVGEAVYDGPYASFDAGSHDYGDVRMNAHTRWFLGVENIGNDTLTISDITYDDEHFYLDEGSQLPLKIAPLEITQIGTWFNPDNGIDYEATMTITHNGIEGNPYLVSLEGSGLKQSWAMGDELWHYQVYTSWDNSPKAIGYLGDITHDNVEDVIVCAEDNGIRCLNGNSHGIADVMWETFIYSGSIYRQQALQRIMDIDNDGYEDVIVGTAWGDRSVVALSGKTGEQIWKFDTHIYQDGGWIYQVDAKYDYNGDGITDVLAAAGNNDDNTGAKKALCLDGLTGELIWENTPGGVTAIIGIEDFTGDGLPDVAAGVSTSGGYVGRAIGIDGTDGSLKWTSNLDENSIWAIMQLDDITGDGIKDLAVGDFSGHNYLLDMSDGSELHDYTIYGDIILRYQDMGDVNGDGYRDILIAHSGDDAIILNGYDATPVWFESLADQTWVVGNIGDITGDDIDDAIIGTLFGNNYCYFLDGTSGEDIESINYGTPVDAINSIPDIVGDVSMEMVAGGRDGMVTCYSGGPLDPVGFSRIKTANNNLEIWPNPFNDILNIQLEIEVVENVTINIYNINGNKIATPVQTVCSSGTNDFQWNGMTNSGNRISRGIYFVEVIAGQKTFKERIIRLN